MSPGIVFVIQDGYFGYRGVSVLQGIDLTIEKGKFYGLIGPNGSGKSTLIELLTSTVAINTGTVELYGKPIETYRKTALARLLALVPQDFILGFDFTVFDIVMMGRHPHIPRFSGPSTRDLDLVENALSVMDIGDLRNRLITDLSGGEKQRVVVARALAQDTEILILDEATSNLDIRHTIEIMRVVFKLVRDKKVTVIAAIHDLNLAAAFCDELIVLKNGRIATCGPVHQVLTEDLLRQVFGVDGHVSVHPSTNTPRVEYELHRVQANG